MLAQRIGSAVVLLLLLLPAAFLGGWWFFLFLTTFGAVALWEMRGLLHHAGFHVWTPVLFGLSFGLILAMMFPRLELVPPLVAAALVAASAWQLSRCPEERSIGNWAVTVATALYFGWLGAQLMAVRQAPQGLAWTIFLFAIVFMTDTAAYFGGRAFGRRPFSPTISPKKTWEGAVIGWAVGTLFAVGLARFLQLPLSPAVAVALGLLTSMASALGDLTMSFFKRQAHVKDASHLIPGHGGFLDRLDSVLPAAAVVATYIFWFVS